MLDEGNLQALLSQRSKSWSSIVSPPVKDKTGLRFGRLVVVEKSRTKSRSTKWKCLCDCGNIHFVGGGHLTGGEIRSCGCLRSESSRKNGRANKTHGRSHKNDPTFRTWVQMRHRCQPSNKDAKYYANKGVVGCERWNFFENFLADMGEKPQGMTLDRYPNTNGNYEPSNCRWATMTQQNRNRSYGHWLTFRGHTLTIGEWSEITGLTWNTIQGRLKRGWSIGKTLMTPRS